MSGVDRLVVGQGEDADRGVRPATGHDQRQVAAQGGPARHRPAGRRTSAPSPASSARSGGPGARWPSVESGSCGASSSPKLAAISRAPPSTDDDDRGRPDVRRHAIGSSNAWRRRPQAIDVGDRRARRRSGSRARCRRNMVPPGYLALAAIVGGRGSDDASEFILHPPRAVPDWPRRDVVGAEPRGRGPRPQRPAGRSGSMPGYQGGRVRRIVVLAVSGRHVVRRGEPSPHRQLRHLLRSSSSIRRCRSRGRSACRAPSR